MNAIDNIERTEEFERRRRRETCSQAGNSAGDTAGGSMSGRDAVDPTYMSWERVWALFDGEEQHAILGVFWDAWHDGEFDQAAVARVLNRLSREIKHRRESLRGRDRGWMIQQLHPRAAKVFNGTDWEAAFRAYYSRHKRDLMCRFLDLLGIEHDDRGMIPGEWDPPDEPMVRGAIPELLKSYSAREVARYLAVLAGQNEKWHAVGPEMGRLLAPRESSDGLPTDPRPEAGKLDPAGASAEFNVLDRVLIREIVRSVAGIEGALDAEELDDLVRGVIALNEARHRNYFHLGLMHVLCPASVPDFDRPELNDARREWYLAGIVAGLVRTRDAEALRGVVAARAAEFARAAAASGGPGESMAKLGIRFFAESGLLSEATALLRGQLKPLGLALAEPALELATGYVRQNEFGSARAIIDVLRQHTSLITGEVSHLHAFRQELERRWGQCLQAAGDFAGAETAFKRLDDGAGIDGSPDLLADRGLVKGRFRSLGEVRLPDTQEQRTNLRDALASGEPHFRKAVEAHGVDAPKACYALAMLAYLRYALERPGSARREPLRVDALDARSRRRHGDSPVDVRPGLRGDGRPRPGALPAGGRPDGQPRPGRRTCGDGRVARDHRVGGPLPEDGAPGARGGGGGRRSGDGHRHRGSRLDTPAKRRTGNPGGLQSALQLRSAAAADARAGATGESSEVAAHGALALARSCADPVEQPAGRRRRGGRPRAARRGAVLRRAAARLVLGPLEL